MWQVLVLIVLRLTDKELGTTEGSMTSVIRAVGGRCRLLSACPGGPNSCFSRTLFYTWRGLSRPPSHRGTGEL